MALVKSSLVFVLVEGGRLAALISLNLKRMSDRRQPLIFLL
jgi:hypothetical protein